MILLYHHVFSADAAPGRWRPGQPLPVAGLPVESFERQLRSLRRWSRIVTLQEYLELLERNRGISRRVVALTFDDGLASTFRNVYPILQAHTAPATFFIATDHLEGGALLWFNYLNALCFGDVYETVECDGATFPLRTMQQRNRARRMLNAIAEARMDPRAFSADLAARYPLPGHVAAGYQGMTVQQLVACRGSEFVEVGSHTVTHPYLDRLSREMQAAELRHGKTALEQIVGRRVRYFAYPGGAYNQETLALVAEAGYDAAFATDPRRLPGEPRFQVERVGIYSASLVRLWLKASGASRLIRRGVKALRAPGPPLPVERSGDRPKPGQRDEAAPLTQPRP